ncbi:DNA-directed RNA polymerase I subunit RPA43 [Xenopus laevis]|uniref:DNA-directed RNA polymerase subunit n=4 Tax=Xenopus laevis TaxID=8355 RepID=A0A1L8FVY7_XENLA|nr:DNA-directed RNA polymerase I subunit RPA43 [Xenopus laevis]OCT75767.1 hypothetical protein XELAEV_18030954mg [Xenopus laevis]
MAEAETAVGSSEPAPAAPEPPALPCLVLPSFSEACELVSCRYSCLVVETHRRHLALSPKFLRKKRSGIQEQLNTELLKYSERLNGVPVAYDNIKLVGELGDIYDDLGHIHINVEADFVIFKPDCGQTLVGIVNKVAPTHIGCLVHGCFNASIPKPPKMPIENWLRIGVKIDDEIEFEVFRLDSDAIGVFCIRGRLDESMEAKAYETSCEETAEQTDGGTSDKDADALENSNMESSIQTNGDVQDKSKKKHKKQKLRESLTQEAESTGDNSIVADPDLENPVELNVETPKKERKKKKHKNVLGQNSESDAEKGLDSTSFEESINTESPVILTETKPKKSKKKGKEILHSNDTASGFLNGVVENESFSESPALEPEEMTASGGVPDKFKKKHKRSNVEQNPNSNLVSCVSSEESLTEGLAVSQETPKAKKHKSKHQEHLLPGSSQSKHKTAKRQHEEDDQDILALEPKIKKKHKK